LNWKEQIINGAMTLTRVVLKEGIEVPTDDEFVSETVTQIRVLDLPEGAYRQRLYRMNKDNEWEKHGADILPMKGGVPLPAIQFVFIGAEANGPEVQKPPILDLVNVNWGHYQNSASFENGAHFTALPTPVITGHKIPDGEAIAIGSETFLVLSTQGAEAFFMEFAGTGLGTLVSAMDKKENQMAVLGARMLSEDKKGVEAADTARIHRSGEAGVLGSLAGSVGKGILRALAMAAEWAGAVATSVEFELNKDFLPTAMSPALMKEMLMAWQSGGISHQIYFDNMKRGEVIGAETDFETMKTEIDNDIPGGGAPPATPPASPGEAEA
jgi:hypothetical protein